MYQPSRRNKNEDSNRLIIGRKPLLEAIKEGSNIDKIFILRTANGEDINEIIQAGQERNIPISKVPIEKLNRLTEANHQGVVALAGLITFQSLEEIIHSLTEKGVVPFIVVSDGITDTRNLGALARAAYCFGANALVLPVSNNAIITEETIKTSAGALEHLPVCRLQSIEVAFDILHLNGIQTVASTLTSDNKIQDIDLTVPVALILGSEDKGVSKFVLKKSTHLAKIPMKEHFDSLNVAVAGGVLFYETFKQRCNG